ncbi:hypothetical protein LSAT2_004370 [Lamellibrachia satsuma]|nr:hypothetical protein LSAT2_004370 [Lamellibrachia satsuma]
MEEIYYVGDRQVALLRSIERRTVEANEGLHCLPRSSGKRKCYKFVQIEMNRTEARTYCQNLGDGVDLVSIESQQENNFLYTVTKGLLPGPCHTSGQKKSGVWQWTATGQPFNYTAWPDYDDYYGDFCYIHGAKEWTGRYDIEGYFICEYPLCG